MGIFQSKYSDFTQIMTAQRQVYFIENKTHLVSFNTERLTFDKINHPFFEQTPKTFKMMVHTKKGNPSCFNTSLHDSILLLEYHQDGITTLDSKSNFDVKQQLRLTKVKFENI